MSFARKISHDNQSFSNWVDNMSICYVPRVIKQHIAKHLSYPSLSLYEETRSFIRSVLRLYNRRCPIGACELLSFCRAKPAGQFLGRAQAHRRTIAERRMPLSSQAVTFNASFVKHP